ncbi:RING finger and CHY zinc finger domain-containing protein 1-like [Thraustotheca clavata]|uniref:RING finger and CHY zinc finger domain-containing protein 1-like n=1 Tax=Thraustotheca clavata TaxID=74557 RepID=A0A1W0A9S7_9STRA|nr:RING finger and CHY zinc finger domain-containing protein 1-like [Thraustotheca clavata]
MSCEHYERGCHLLAECCQQWFPCRLCHNDANPSHEMNRHDVVRVRCRKCHTEQAPEAICIKCKFVLGKYFCAVCNMFDNKGEEKGIFHCQECGICRVGGRNNFFHCKTCAGCYHVDTRDEHVCVQQAMLKECCICLEYMFNSRQSPSVLRCGHVLHRACYKEMIKYRIECPLCRKCLVPESVLEEMRAEQEQTDENNQDSDQDTDEHDQDTDEHDDIYEEYSLDEDDQESSESSSS